MLLAEKSVKVFCKEYDMTVFQTREYGETKGYRQVYRCKVKASDHEEALYSVYKVLNVKDLLPNPFNGRYMTTGDIVFIDEGIGGHRYYQLKTGGWKTISRIHIC